MDMVTTFFIGETMGIELTRTVRMFFEQTYNHLNLEMYKNNTDNLNIYDKISRRCHRISKKLDKMDRLQRKMARKKRILYSSPVEDSQYVSNLLNKMNVLWNEVDTYKKYVNDLLVLLKN